MQKTNLQKIERESCSFKDAGRQIESTLSMWDIESISSSISLIRVQSESKREDTEGSFKTLAKKIPMSPINLGFKSNSFFSLKEKDSNHQSQEKLMLQRRNSEIQDFIQQDREQSNQRSAMLYSAQDRAQNDYFLTQPAEIPLHSQSIASFFKDKRVNKMYDKENNHSGMIASFKSIQPKSTLLSSLSQLSHRFLDSSKSLYNETFLNRKRCKCDINLSASQTCSIAEGLLNSKYKNMDKAQMKKQYKSLLSMTDLYAPFKSQIDKDAQRTFPEAQLFQEGQSLSQELKNVLYAFSIYDIQIGYVQGMNLIVGAILNHAEEYMAFWMTCMIFESLEMRDIFLPGELVDRSVLNGLYTDRLTRNSEACTDNDIRIEDLCSQWILSLGAVFVPLNQMIRLIEMVMEKGWSFFYRLIISYILFHEDKILKSKEPEDVLLLLAGQSYSLEKRGQNIQWECLLKSAERIYFNEAVVSELLEKFDIETMSIENPLEFPDDSDDDCSKHISEQINSYVEGTDTYRSSSFFRSSYK